MNRIIQFNRFRTIILFFIALLIMSRVHAQSNMDINQTISDGAQKNTIAFDGLAFMTGDFCSCTFLPPGKVADYCGFQFYRDNDITGMGHNTDFLTIIANNVLDLLDTSQIHVLFNLANNQVAEINQYADMRFPMIKAFVRLYENDIPAGSSGLNKDTVREYSSRLYLLDGKIAYDRAKVYGEVLRSLSVQQLAHMDSLAAIPGVANWDTTILDPLAYLHPPHDQKIALMTYASEMFTWYAGDVVSDTYFCPERQCTYYGSFYMKDIPAVGNPGYSIDTNLTQHGGDLFLNTLTTSQKNTIVSLVDTNRADLYNVVDLRTQISALLRGFIVNNTIDSATVMNLSMDYGRLDGEMSYHLAVAFANVGQLLTQAQMDTLYHIRNLDTFPCNGAYLYSQNIGLPVIQNTDFFFNQPLSVNTPETDNPLTVSPNPFNDFIGIRNASGQENFELVDALGQIIWSGKNIEKHNFHDLKPSVYFMKVTSGKSVRVIKLLKR